MRVVVDERDVGETKIKKRPHRRIELDRGQTARLPRKLDFRLPDVIEIQVGVAETVDEMPGREIADLGDHQREEGVRRDVEGNTQENVRAALVQVTGQASARDVELKENVARGQSHLRELPDVPRADDVAPGA